MTPELLKSVQFVVGQDGKPAAVQLDMATWQALLDWLEEVEDRRIVQEILPRLRQAPQKTGALRWDDVKDQWSSADTDEGP